MKLSLRELFLLVIIAAMGCGWWVSYQNQETEIFRRDKAIYDAGFNLIGGSDEPLKLEPGMAGMRVVYELGEPKAKLAR